MSWWIDRWSWWSWWRSENIHAPFHLCPKQLTSSRLSSPGCKMPRKYFLWHGFPQREADCGHGAVKKRLWVSHELCGFGWGSDEQGQEPWWEGEDYVSLCTTARCHSLLVSPEHLGLPVSSQGWLPNLSVSLHVADHSTELQPGARGIQSPALFTQNTRHFCFQTDSYCHSLLLKFLGSRHLF